MRKGDLCLCFVLCAVILALAPVARAADPNPPTIQSNRGAWPLYRQWNLAEVRHFATWIENIYRVKTEGAMAQRLAKIEAVLTDPETNWLLDQGFAGEVCNPQLGPETMRAMHSILDCGKLTIALTGYYAYRRGLPWMISTVRSGDGTDIRTAAYTIPAGQSSCLDYRSPHAFFTEAITCFCTGNYRVPPAGERAELSDTAPVALTREHLLPGAMYYMDGHVLILARVDKYGEVYFLDATTSPTRDIYTYNRMNAVSGLTPAREGADRFAGCYRGFRIHRFPIAEVDGDGNVLRIRRRTDAEMMEFGYSTEQYERLLELTTTGSIATEAWRADSFHSYLRRRLATVPAINPTQMLTEAGSRLLALMEFREQRVREAWAEVQQHGPIEFPEGLRTETVFNTRGRWGIWSSAALDAQVRGEYFHLLSMLDQVVGMYAVNPDYVDLQNLPYNAIWTRADLAYAIIQEKNRQFARHQFTYSNTAGQPVTLTLLDVERRLYDLSFDPNHPPELRWGAGLGSAEAGLMLAVATPLPNNYQLPMEEAYSRQAYYRTLSHWDTDQSYLRDMVTEGFPVQNKLDEYLALWYSRDRSPRLVPSRSRLHAAAGQARATSLELK
jgi:hypothetical protein